MNSTILRARTVSIVKDFTVEKRQGANGEFESKSILFRIAVDRDYQVSVTENGITGKKRPTDFWLAKCTGEIAERFNKYCTEKDANGKLVSRHLLLGGNFEQYEKQRVVKAELQTEINGQLYNVAGDVNVTETRTIFVVNDIEFLDGRKSTGSTNTGSSVSIASATPVAAGTTATASATPSATVSATATSTGEEPMNPPVIEGEFSPEGQEAPF